jgi:GTP cyclohydrolase II
LSLAGTRPEALPVAGGRRLVREAEARLPTRFGEFRVVAYRDAADGRAHLALVVGEVRGRDRVFAHIHRSCLLGEAFGSLGCSCGALLEGAMERAQREGRGVIVYVARGGGGSSSGGGCPEDGVGACEVGAAIFEDLGLRSVRLLPVREVLGS